MRKLLFAILLLIVVGFGYVGYTNLDDSSFNAPSSEQNDEY
ncbi:hypothetical protein Q7A53_18785 [Halobacillus rhizosphaerae]